MENSTRRSAGVASVRSRRDIDHPRRQRRERAKVGFAVAILVSSIAGQSNGQSLIFTHDNGSVGAAGSAVFAAPDRNDLFQSPYNNTNTLFANNPAALGLQAGDNIDAFSDDGSRVMSGTGRLTPAFLFSVRAGATGQPGTAVAARAPQNGADLFVINSPTPGHFLSHLDSSIGMSSVNTSESIDGMATNFGSNFASGKVLFSLAAGSPTLAALGASPADILTARINVAGSLRIAIRAQSLGLLTSDDVDAISVFDAADTNGDGLLDYATVFFSVKAGSQGASGTAVRSELLRNGNQNDIFLSMLSNSNYRGYDGIDWIRLGSGDDIDALDVFVNPPFAGPPGLPNPPPAPAPLRPPGGEPPKWPFDGGWIAICSFEAPLTMRGLLRLTLVHPNGESEFIDTNLNGTMLGFAVTDSCRKAAAFTILLNSAMTQNGIPVFTDVATGPPDHFPGNPAIQKEVCFNLNPALSAVGVRIDACDFEIFVDGWTAGWIPNPRVGVDTPRDPNMPLTPIGRRPCQPTYRLPRLSIDYPPTGTGTYGVTFGNADSNDPSIVTYSITYHAGETPTDILCRIGHQVQDDGGRVRLTTDPNSGGAVLEVARVAIEPANQSDGHTTLGPYLYEAGASANLPTRVGGAILTARPRFKLLDPNCGGGLSSTCPSPECSRSDMNHDCRVDLEDLAILLSQSAANGEGNLHVTAQPVDEGGVDITALSTMLADFGTVCD